MTKDKRICKLNTQENRLLCLPYNEVCSIEQLGIKCKPETREACKRAELCYACRKTECKGCNNL